MSVVNRCAVCSTETNQLCSNCHSVFYCDRVHQKQDWKKHKLKCRPVEIDSNDVLGRYLKSGRSYERNEIIMIEKQLISGPSQTTPAVCLGCYKKLEQKTAIDCSKCGWPFCSIECTKDDRHEPECHFTTKFRKEKVKINAYGVIHPSYKCITVLRCLYQRDNNIQKWQQLMSLQSHCDKRFMDPLQENERKTVLDLIHKFFKLQECFSGEEVIKCLGILQVNGHEIPLMEPSYVAVYNKISLLEHNCRPNCCKSFTPEGQMIISAGVRISQGEHLSVCYTDPLWGSEARRHHLAETKFFECSCERCTDPSEFKTFFSAIKCQKKDCKGYLLPKTFLTPILNDKVEKVELDKPWHCDTCQDTIKDDVVQKLLEDIGKEINSMTKGNIEVCERFIDHCSTYLHPAHYYITDVALAMAQMIGQRQKPDGSFITLVDESDDRLDLKMELCRKLAELFDVIAPAERRGRGCLLFELHAAIVESGRRISLLEGPVALFPYLTEARNYLVESAQLLTLEPDVLPEGQIRKQAFENIKELNKVIEKISKETSNPF